MQSPVLEPFPRNVLYARIDGVQHIQDYPPGLPCVRLIGVSGPSFNEGAYNNERGCETYIVDLPYKGLMRGWDVLQLARLRWLHDHTLSPQVPSFDENQIEDDPGAWIRVDYQIAPSPAEGRSYAYPAFRGGAPTYLKVHELSLVRGRFHLNSVPLARAVQFFPAVNGGGSVLQAFHVGQGMCSLLSNSSTGYLFDAGAGTPINRAIYRRGRHANRAQFRNDLATACSGLKNLSAFISHPDSDHWRMLEWDLGLINKIHHVYVPANTASLATRSPVVVKKVVGIGTHSIAFDNVTTVDVFRSQPATKTSNSDCLVATVDLNGHRALLPGDYVYEEMCFDGSPQIARLPGQPFTAVVVPHHGDHASANHVPAPANHGKSLAFFSAGDHIGYGHPTNHSLNSHWYRGYQNINRHLCPDIIAQPLLP